MLASSTMLVLPSSVSLISANRNFLSSQTITWKASGEIAISWGQILKSTVAKKKFIKKKLIGIIFKGRNRKIELKKNQKRFEKNVLG